MWHMALFRSDIDGSYHSHYNFPGMTPLMPARDDIKRDAFVKEYAACGNGTQAALSAGVPAKSAAVTASRWLRNPEISAMVREEMDRQIKHLAPMAVKVLAQLIEDEETPASIRLSACRDVLDRAQYVAPRRMEARIDLGVRSFTQMTRTELETLVASRSPPRPPHQAHIQSGHSSNTITDVADAADVADFYVDGK